MSLRDLDIKKFYDSDSDDILNSFYVPALSVSSKYQRLAGFFSSSTLAIAARGIAGLIANKGKMELVCGAKLRKEDVEAILEGSRKPVDVIEHSALEDLQNLENLYDELVSNHVKALGWMIANKLLEIKVAVVTTSTKKPLDYVEVIQTGVFHQKVGILEDGEGNRISFSGSDNESAAAWLSNIEEFKVFCSWDGAEKKYLEADCIKFSKFWHGKAKRVEILDVPNAVRKKLIEIAPDHIERLILDERIFKKRKKKKEIQLWNHQVEAIEKWLKNDKRCIFEMATGTGKTFAALGCVKRLMSEEKKLVTVIACPYNHLIKQWENNVNEFKLNIDSIVVDSSNPRWKGGLIDCVRDMNNDVRDKLIVFTTHDTFYSKDFIDIIERCRNRLFLIGDEVHEMGSEERKKGLIEKYQYRLGLSATPSRWFDPEGTSELLSYFNIKKEDDIFSFPLEKAIKTINPVTGKTYLTPYEYRPYFVELNDEELEEYQRQTQKIARAYYICRNKQDKWNYFRLLCIKRQEIVKNAINKYEVLKVVLDDIDELAHCLIYCSPEQIGTVQKILNSKGIIQHRFTQKEDIKPDERYGGISERDYLLKKFAEGSYRVLVAMKCLDEGIDVPQAKIGIILASTGNPRQYIQRRGRLLRRFPGKDKAVIYDFIVVPLLARGVMTELIELERKILARELERYEEFGRISTNYIDCVKKIHNLENRLGL